MSRSIIAVVAIGAVLISTLLTTGVASARAGTCSVVAAPCDASWHSGMNQTFAFLGVADPNVVQLYSYWGSSKGCLNNTSPSVNATTLSLSWATCSAEASIWRYGPGAIQTYVYYNNTNGDCLSLKPNANEPQAPTLGVKPCCYKPGQVCTAVELAMQMWLEPATSKNPYSRILSQYNVNGVAFCLTRVGTDC